VRLPADAAFPFPMTAEDPARLDALRRAVDVLSQAGPDDRLASFSNWDSLAVLLVITHFEHDYGVSVTGASVRACVTVRDLLSLLPPARS
jgi:acyl carrier protein